MKIPGNFRGLLYAPSTESELGLLLGMLLPYLEPPICIIEGEFQVSDKSWPDLKVKIFENKRWRSYRVEFEVKSATFVKHRHNPNNYDKIICREDNWHILSGEDKIKYKKFCKNDNRIRLKTFLERSKNLNMGSFILNPRVHSKSIYKNTFAVICQCLEHFEALRKHVARDYVSYFKNKSSFIQIKPIEQRKVAVYISGRIVETLDNPMEFAKDISIFNPRVTPRQKDFSFSIDSLPEANAFIAVLNKHLRDKNG